MAKAGLMINKNLPEDIKEIILNKQLAMKLDCQCIQSQVQAIYKIIRESRDAQNENKAKRNSNPNDYKQVL